MTFQITPAKREKTHALLMLAGESGGGKTYSALQIAKGLANGGKIGFIDTENRRGRHYADLVPFDVIDLGPPFTPERYLEAVKVFEQASYPVIVIDSMTHEWDGEGGCVEMAGLIEQRTKKPGLHCWAKPKSDHKRLMNRLLQINAHIIFCCRAKEKFEQVKNNKGRQEIISVGLDPIQEKDFKYEMTASLMVHADKPGYPVYMKVPDELAEAFPKDKQMTTNAGELLRVWCEAGVDTDKPVNQEPVKKKLTPKQWVDVAKEEISGCTQETDLHFWLTKNKPAFDALNSKEPDLANELNHFYENKLGDLTSHFDIKEGST